MNYQKTYPVPAKTARVLRLPVSRLRAGDSVRELYLLHVAEGERGLECAEGLKEAGYTQKVPGTIADVYATPDEIFALYNGEGDARYLFGMENRRNYSDRATSPIRCIVPVAPLIDYSLPQTWYVVTDADTWRCCVYEGSRELGSGLGGIYGAEYAGRFFLLDKRRLSYTAPYDEAKWSYTENGKLQQFGYIEIPPRCGEFVGGACLGEKLYLFARAGVVEVTMGGKTLGGKTRYIPQAVGETLGGTIQVIGDRAYFFTEKGLCTFDGENFRRVFTPCSRRIDLSAECKTGTWRGKYYAFAAFDDGERRVYVYDPLTERETFLNVGAEKFCAGIKAVAVKNNALYTLAEKVLPDNGDPCMISCRLSLNGGKNMRVDWVRVEGEGKFEVEAATDGDGAARAQGNAGRELQLSRSLFGDELYLTVASYDAGFLVTGIAVGMGEGTDDD